MSAGRPSSTIGFERPYNPVLQLGRDEFLRLESQPTARPLNMTAILETNRGSADHAWAQLRHAEDAPTISVDEAPAWLAQRNATVLDVREPQEHLAGHLPGAISIPQADLATRLAEIPKAREVLVVCAGGMRSAKCAAFLRQTGLDNVTSLDGGTDGWRAAGLPVES